MSEETQPVTTVVVEEDGAAKLKTTKAKKIPVETRVFFVKYEELVDNDINVREKSGMDDSSLRGLAMSIMRVQEMNADKDGLIEAIKVVKGLRGWTIRDGTRRYKAIGMIRSENGNSSYERVRCEDVGKVWGDRDNEELIGVTTQLTKSGVSPFEFACRMNEIGTTYDEFIDANGRVSEDKHSPKARRIGAMLDMLNHSVPKESVQKIPASMLLSEYSVWKKIGRPNKRPTQAEIAQHSEGSKKGGGKQIEYGEVSKKFLNNGVLMVPSAKLAMVLIELIGKNKDSKWAVSQSDTKEVYLVEYV